MSFIELTLTFGIKKIVNTTYIVAISEHKTPSETYIQVEFYDGELMKCKNSYSELCTLLNVDTIEKRIEKLKYENFKKEQKLQYENLITTLTGGREK